MAAASGLLSLPSPHRYAVNAALPQPEANPVILVHEEGSSNFRHLRKDEPLTIALIQRTWEAFQRIMCEKIGAERSHETIKKSFLEECDYVRKKGSPLTERTFEMLSCWVFRQPPLKQIEPSEREWRVDNLTEGVKKQLVFEAQKTRVCFFGEYSSLSSGAVILTRRGGIICATSSDYSGSMLCAEQNALTFATMKFVDEEQWKREIVAIALVSKEGLSPCEKCLQALIKVNAQMVLIRADASGAIKTFVNLEQLLKEKADRKK